MASATQPDAILDRFPGPVVLAASRGKWLAVLAGCAVFVAFGVWAVADPAALAGTGRGHYVDRLLVDIGLAGDPVAAVELVGISALVFFGLGVVVSGVSLLPNASGLTLDGEGFAVRNMFQRRAYAWSEADHFAVITVGLRKMVAYDEARGIGARAVRALTGRSSALPDTYGLSADDLAGLMAAWRERALG